jgi:hypothetical protein
VEVVNFASPKSVYMLKSVEKCLCKTRNYKKVAGSAIWNYSTTLKFWKKITCKVFFSSIDVFKSKVSNDLDEN